MIRCTLIALATLTILAGCSAGFPYGTSWDRHNFASDYHLPKHIALVDTTNDKTIWETDVPVGKQLLVDLEHDQDWTPNLSPAVPATSMRWCIIENGTLVSTPLNENTIKLDGHPVLLKMTITERKEASDPIPTATDVQ